MKEKTNYIYRIHEYIDNKVIIQLTNNICRQKLNIFFDT